MTSMQYRSTILIITRFFIIALLSIFISSISAKDNNNNNNNNNSYYYQQQQQKFRTLQQQTMENSIILEQCIDSFQPQNPNGGADLNNDGVIDNVEYLNLLNTLVITQPGCNHNNTTTTEISNNNTATTNSNLNLVNTVVNEVYKNYLDMSCLCESYSPMIEIIPSPVCCDTTFTSVIPYYQYPTDYTYIVCVHTVISLSNKCTELTATSFVSGSNNSSNGNNSSSNNTDTDITAITAPLATDNSNNSSNHYHISFNDNSTSDNSNSSYWTLMNRTMNTSNSISTTEESTAQTFNVSIDVTTTNSSANASIDARTVVGDDDMNERDTVFWLLLALTMIGVILLFWALYSYYYLLGSIQKRKRKKHHQQQQKQEHKQNTVIPGTTLEENTDSSEEDEDVEKQEQKQNTVIPGTSLQENTDSVEDDEDLEKQPPEDSNSVTVAFPSNLTQHDINDKQKAATKTLESIVVVESAEELLDSDWLISLSSSTNTTDDDIQKGMVTRREEKLQPAGENENAKDATAVAEIDDGPDLMFLQKQVDLLVETASTTSISGEGQDDVISIISITNNNEIMNDEDLGHIKCLYSCDSIMVEDNNDAENPGTMLADNNSNNHTNNQEVEHHHDPQRQQQQQVSVEPGPVSDKLNMIINIPAVEPMMLEDNLPRVYDSSVDSSLNYLTDARVKSSVKICGLIVDGKDPPLPKTTELNDCFNDLMMAWNEFQMQSSQATAVDDSYNHGKVSLSVHDFDEMLEASSPACEPTSKRRKRRTDRTISRPLSKTFTVINGETVTRSSNKGHLKTDSFDASALVRPKEIIQIPDKQQQTHLQDMNSKSNTEVTPRKKSQPVEI